MALRMNVEGLMGDLLYQNLGTEPDVDVAWSYIREYCGMQLFGNEYVAVPFIQHAQYYNQLFVFTKERSILNSLGFRPPKYKVIGNMDYLVDRNASTWTPQFDLSPWDIVDSHSMYKRLKVRVNSNQPGDEKEILFMVWEPHARTVQLPTPRCVKLHRNLLQELNGVSKVYVITEVVLASYVHLKIRIGNRQTVFINDRAMPIGFKYRKYKLGRDGTFVAELNHSLKIRGTEAVWLRPLPQPIPTIPRPLWQQLNPGGKKLWSHLTIPSSCEGLAHPDPLQAFDDVVNQPRRTLATTALNRYGIANEEFQAMPPRRLVRSVSMETMPGSN